tara:strand:+ start:2956 stop:3888 length:933 start_codon:yes stop_codon:yes gene_type:complete
MEMKILTVVVIAFFLFEKINALENKIIIKINNQIITSVDLKNEQQYLYAMNTSVRSFTKKEVYEIAKKSLIAEKIKEIDISKYYKLSDVSDEYVKDILKKLMKSKNFQNEKEYKQFLIENSLDYRVIEKKIRLQVAWNNLIQTKYLNKIVINEDEIRKKIKENIKNSSTQISYNLSEIFFTPKIKDDVDKILNIIEQRIRDQSFESAATFYSVSDSASNGGKIGWVDEINLSKEIRKNIKNLKVGEYSKPIAIVGGYLILMINNKKSQIEKINEDEQFKKYIEYEKTKQLNIFSKIYYSKLKINININEK